MWGFGVWGPGAGLLTSWVDTSFGETLAYTTGNKQVLGVSKCSFLGPALDLLNLALWEQSLGIGMTLEDL